MCTEPLFVPCSVARTNELPEGDTSCVETCRSSLFVISTIIVTDIYVHSLVELQIIKKCRVPLLRFSVEFNLGSYLFIIIFKFI